MRTATLIIGGYVNGYSILNELHYFSTPNLYIVDSVKNIASYSKKNRGYFKCKINEENLRNILLELLTEHDFIVLFPTSEDHIKTLTRLRDEFKERAFFPFNQNVLKYLEKNKQYDICDKLGIPYPKSIILSSTNYNIENINLMYPVLIKPLTKYSFKTFRILRIENKEEFKKNKDYINQLIAKGAQFLVSEIVEGPSSNIYSHNILIGKNGDIIEDWGGRKITQSPDDYGVMSTTSTESNEVVKKYSFELMQAIRPIGIFEPEFKFDERDQKYKLMEIGFRPTMWNKVGFLQGVFLNQNLYNDAISQNYIRPVRNQEKLYMVYAKHEIINIVFRRHYFKFFLKNIYRYENKKYVIFDKKDIKPFIYDCYRTIKLGVSICIKNIKTKL